MRGVLKVVPPHGSMLRPINKSIFISLNMIEANWEVHVFATNRRGF